MAITIVQTSTGATQTGANTVATTFPANVTAGNGLVVVTGSSSSQTPSSITDNSGGSTNTYTKLMEQGASGGSVIDGFQCLSVVTGAFNTLTAHLSGTGTSFILAWEIAGTLTALTHNSNTSNSASHPCGSITVNTPEDVALFAVDRCSSSLNSVPGGYNSSYLTISFGAAYQVVTVHPGTVNPAFTASASVLFASGVMAFTSNQTGGSPWEPPYRVKLQDDTRYFFDPRTNATRLGAALLAGSGAPPSFFLPHPYREPPDPRPGEPQKGDIRRPFIFGLTPSPPPPGPGHADKTPFIRRLPAGTSEDDKRRSERAHDQLSSLLNSLIGQGIAVQLSPEKWTWRGGARVENRHPTMIDDLTQGVVVGQMWICSTDLTKWICVDNTHNFAVWVAF